MKILIACFFAVGFSLISPLVARENPDAIWTTRPITRSWVVKGKIVAYDPGRANDRFFWSAVYFDRKGEVWPLLGSSWNVVQMIRSELPDGISADFVRHDLISALTDFNSTRVLLGDKVSIETYIDNIFSIHPDEEREKQLRLLIDTPDIKIHDNHWELRFLTLAACDRIQINETKGTLKPFSVESEKRFL